MAPSAKRAADLERDRLLAAERAARHRIEQLQSLTARLSAAQVPADVAHATLDAGSGAVGSPFGVLYLVEARGDGGADLVLAHAYGYDGAALDPWRRRPATTAMPGAEAIARRRPVLLASRHEIAERYPVLRPLLDSTPRHASAVFPLAASDEAPVIGFISFDFDRDRALSADEVDFLGTLARLCAQALERARLLEAERAAREALARSHAATREEAERVQLALAAGAIAGTWDWDLATGRFKLDDRFADSFGIDPAPGREAIGLEHILASVHPDDLPGLRTAIADAIARGGPYVRQYRVRGRDGRYRWIEANGRVDLGADGSPLRFPGVLLDLESRRAVEAERDRATSLLRAFVDAVPGVLYAKDRDGRMLLANRGTAELIGRPLEAILGLTDAEFLERPEQAAAVMENDRRIVDGGRAETVEEEVSFADGRHTVWLSTKAPFRDADGRIVGLIGASVDITARKDAERALKEADRRKDEFLAMLAHELRNPLSPIVNAARLLGREPALGPIGRQALAMIERQTRHLRRLVDDLLEMSRLTRGTLRLRTEPLELGPLVQAAVDAIGPAAQGKRQTLRSTLPAGPVRVDADPVRLGQIVENLLGNAVKYTHEGGAIGIELAEADGAVEIRVTDDGIGIDPDALEAVFELFVQAEPGVGEHQGGLGIGLALVRHLVELHGGSVWAESAGRGRGARFVVRLPTAPGDGPVR